MKPVAFKGLPILIHKIRIFFQVTNNKEQE